MQLAGACLALAILLAPVISSDNSSTVSTSLPALQQLTSQSDVPPPAPQLRPTRSLARRYLDYTRGFDDDDDDDDDDYPDVWTPRRRRAGRVASLPVLLVPVDLEDGAPAGNKRWSNRRPVKKYEEDEDFNEQPRVKSRPRPYYSYGQGNGSPYRDDYDTRQNSSPLLRTEKQTYSEDQQRRTLQHTPGTVYRQSYSEDREWRPYKRTDSARNQQDSLEERHVTEPSAPAMDRDPQVSTEQLVQMFKDQKPSSPSMPPILQSEYAASELIVLPDDEDDEQTEVTVIRTPRQITGGPPRVPPRPVFSRPLKLRAVLTVPRADFSESYVMWWNPTGGEARIHFHGGSAVTFRKTLSNGLVRKVEMHVDRTKQRAVHCGVSLSPAAATDRDNPALPDMQLFKFVEFVNGIDEARVERWEHVATQRAAGETLTTRHEVILTRDDDQFVRPLRYKVSVDSSALGVASDAYEHVYVDARSHSRAPEFFEVNIDEYCDKVDHLNTSLVEHSARLEPLREFTSPYRDPRYDDVFQSFKKKFDRQYANNVEEAIRKNLLMQTTRFVSSGNRAGATSRMAVNYLSDRLDSELSALAGVVEGRDTSRADPPPPRRAVSAMEHTLPQQFDWRQRGAVSAVQHQGRCSSCWAFAVSGAVEGALFKRTGRLVPLSQQCLVDCAHHFGGKGCNGTWPSKAYDYVKNRGLPALDQYTQYRAKKLQCRDDSFPAATRISGHVDVIKYSVPALQVAIMEQGPVVVLVDCKTKSFLTHSEGVLYDDRCLKRSTRHAMLAVGWGHDEGGELYFIVKNSWSEAWGQRGYVHLHARSNTCGLLAHASYPRLGDEDILNTI